MVIEFCFTLPDSNAKVGHVLLFVNSRYCCINYSEVTDYTSLKYFYDQIFYPKIDSREQLDQSFWLKSC